MRRGYSQFCLICAVWLAGAAGLWLQMTDAVAQAMPGQSMHQDAQTVMISGRATGRAGEPSRLTVRLNGIEFAVTVFPRLTPALTRESEGESAFQTCQLLREQIAAFTLGARTTPEFDADCLPLAGESVLLLIQANPEKYEVPAEDDAELTRWLKEKRRLLHLEVTSTDDTQKLIE